MPKTTPTGYSKHRGCTPQAVFDAIKKGRLVGSVKALANNRFLIDVKAADAEWAANTNTGTGSAAHAKNAPLLTTPHTEPEPGEQITYAEARAQHERFKARLAQLELETRESKLVAADDVKRESYKVARQVRDALLNIPDRVAGELAAETNQFKVHQRLVAEIRRALEELKLE